MTSCVTCKFCEPSPGTRVIGQPGQGVCRLNPPTTQMIPTPQGMAQVSIRTLVDVDKDWCASYLVQLVKEYSTPGRTG